MLGWDLPVLNRGIGGDSTLGLLSRVATIIALRPRAVFIMIGTNDLGYAATSVIVQNVNSIIERFQTELPATLIYVQSIVPSRSPRRNTRAEAVNAGLRGLCTRSKASYVDLYGPMLDEKGLIKQQFTNDGLHLTGDAYIAWKEQVKPIIDELEESVSEASLR